MLDISIIIVSYNVEKYLRDTIASVIKTAPKHLTYEIIVSDNDSKDGSVAMVKKEFPNVILLDNKKNLGFSKGNNVGVKYAKGRYVLFLNPDTVTREHTLETMVKFMDEHPDAGAATCKLEMLSGDIDYSSHRGFPTPWNSFCYFSGLTKIFPTSHIFAGYTQGWADMNAIHEVDCISGAFMIIPRKVGEEVGWWDEDYFFNGEDIDLCFEIRAAGYKIYYVPTVSILHYNGVSGGTKKSSIGLTTADKERKQFVTRQRFTAMKIFYKKHYEKVYPKIVTWLVLQGIELKQTLALRKYQ
jgi:GT2 family glycosyltransferase